MSREKKMHKSFYSFLRYLIVFIIIIICLFPIAVMFSTSFKYRRDISTWPPTFFFDFTFDNYRRVFSQGHLLRYLVNSLSVTLISTFFSIALGTFAAYGIARFKFIGRSVASYSLIILRMIPPVIMVLPLFILWLKTGLLGSRVGLSIAYVAINIPFSVWVIQGFISDIPISLEESAKIDGCSDFKILIKIVLPLLVPALAVASIFTFRTSWNEFILGLVLTDRMTRTLPVMVSLYINDLGIEWGPMLACSSIIAIPAIIFTFAAAKQLIGGITAGAVKG